MDTKKIGQFIAKSRKNKNMTQAQFGEILGVTDKAVSKWECGKCLPDSSLFPKISTVLEVSMSDLLNGNHIEKEDKEIENKTIVSLLSEIEKLKKNEILVSALCALLISFITAIYSLIFNAGDAAYEQFFNGAIRAISAGCLLLGLFLIFKAWVNYSINNSNK